MSKIPKGLRPQTRTPNIDGLVDDICKYFHGKVVSERRASGDDGFEGLIAELMKCLTGLPYHVAASGLQNDGDMLSADATISIQCKAYFASRPPSLKSILADVQVQDLENDQLDTYVLVAPRIHAQKFTDFRKQLGRHGFDAVSLQCSKENPDLLFLLARYWNCVRRHLLLAEMPQPLQDEIESLGKTSLATLDASLDILKKEILDNEWTYSSVQRRSHEYLLKRFGLTGDGTMSGLYPVDMRQAVDRCKSAGPIGSWWTEATKPLLLVEGPEGTGKSWLVAQEALRLASQSGIVVLWMDSTHWSDAASLQDVVCRAWHTCTGVQDSQQEVALRLYHKLQTRWKRPVLLVLDGMNERLCPTAAERIVASCMGARPDRDITTDQEGTDSHKPTGQLWRAPDVLHIIVTSRPFEFRPSAIPDVVIREYASKYRTDSGYTDGELAAVLRKSDLMPTDLPHEARELLRLPGVMSVYLRIRNRLVGVRNITLPMIWWFDLLEKIDKQDSAVIRGLHLHTKTDAEQLLQTLARDVGNASSIPIERLNVLFANRYHDFRQDFSDSRLFRSTEYMGASLSDEHVALGWGLLFAKMLKECTSQDAQSIADEIRRLLEPGLSDQRRSVGILVALQLSLINKDRLTVWSVAGALLAWFSSHNVVFNGSDLMFWARENLDAYVAFVEALFAVPALSTGETVVVSPLAVIWKKGGGSCDRLRDVLKRWLLVTWSHDQPENLKTLQFAGENLPVMRSEYQLRLTSVACSILSQCPDDGLLPSLALCLSSAHLSRAKQQDQVFPAKWPHKSLTPLLRWGYTERVLPLLTELARKETNGEILDGYRKLATWCLGLAKLPPILLLPAKDFRRDEGPRSVEDAVRDFRDPTKYRTNNSYGWVLGMDLLAVRDDLPRLEDQAERRILNTFAQCCENKEYGSGIGTYVFENLWPWAARLDPDAFEASAAVPLLEILGHPGGVNYGILHHYHALIFGSPARQDIFKALMIALSRVQETQVWYVAEWASAYALFHSKGEELIQVFLCIEDFRSERGQVSVVLNLHTCNLLRTFADDELRAFARNRVKRLTNGCDWASSEETYKRVEYWLGVWAYSAIENAEDHEWALVRLRDQSLPQCLRYGVIVLLARSGPDNVIFRLLANNSVRSSLGAEDWRPLWQNVRFSDVVRDTPNLERRIVDEVPLEWRGTIARLAGYKGANDEWVRELILVVDHVIQQPSPGPDAIPPTRFELDEKGVIVSREPVRKESASVMLTPSTELWGVPLGRDGDAVDDRLQVLRNWRESHERLKHWDGFRLHDFFPVACLMEWASENDQEFIAFALRLLDRTTTDEHLVARLGAFLSAILCCLARLDPAKAWQWHKRVAHSSACVTVTSSGCDSVLSSFWQGSVAEKPELHKIRKKILLDAETDEVLMSIATNAVAQGQSNHLAVLCDEFLGEPCARDRCVAVSILPWMGTEEAKQKLETLVKDDPSDWVRDHATWACNVVRQDLASCGCYQRTLGEEDIRVVSAGLQILKPALLPSCRYWRKTIEKLVGFPSARTNSAKLALIRHFWAHWDSVSSSNGPNVCGRRVREYVRGHQIDSFVDRRMAPWWEPTEGA